MYYIYVYSLYTCLSRLLPLTVSEDEVLLIQILMSMPFESAGDEGDSSNDYGSQVSSENQEVTDFLGGKNALLAKPTSIANLVSTSSAVCFWFKIRQTLTTSTAILTIAANDEAGIFGFGFVAVSGKPLKLILIYYNVDLLINPRKSNRCTDNSK